MSRRRCLVTGWFSFPEVVATAGDLLARDVACSWLQQAGRAYDVASIAPLGERGVDWRAAEPGRYDELLFVCGPFGARGLIDGLLDRFAHCRLLGLNLSIPDRSQAWRFDVLFERDGPDAVRPDVTFLSEPRLAPVVGVAVPVFHDEYDLALHARVRVAIPRALAERGVATVDVDTDLLDGERWRSPAQVTALIARTDAVVTTRLHGLVLALRLGIPVVAIDAVRGGGKVTCQAATIDWPAILPGHAADAAAIGGALDWCLTPEARGRAALCRTAARRRVLEVREQFLGALRDLSALPDRRVDRARGPSIGPGR
jgi:hypothetical protein